MPSEQNPGKTRPVATKGQHGHPRSTGGLTVEDRCLTVVAQPQPEDVEEISPHVLEERIPQDLELHAERTGSQQPEEKSSQEETETLNVLVNDRSSLAACTLDLIAPPKLTSQITQLPTL